MPFQKNHKLGARRLGEERLDDIPISFRAKKGIRDKLKKIPNWQEQLRTYVEQLTENKENVGIIEKRSKSK